MACAIGLQKVDLHIGVGSFHPCVTIFSSELSGFRGERGVKTYRSL